MAENGASQNNEQGPGPAVVYVSGRAEGAAQRGAGASLVFQVGLEPKQWPKTGLEPKLEHIFPIVSPSFSTSPCSSLTISNNNNQRIVIIPWQLSGCFDEGVLLKQKEYILISYACRATSSIRFGLELGELIGQSQRREHRRIHMHIYIYVYRGLFRHNREKSNQTTKPPKPTTNNKKCQQNRPNTTGEELHKETSLKISSCFWISPGGQ